MASERLAPDTIAALTNLSGAVADIDDDPDAPDGNWLTAPGNNVSTAARVTFPTPSDSPTTGAGLQEFRVQVRKTNHPTDPSCTLEVFENGVLRATPISAQGVSSTAGVVLSGAWDASVLATADGSGVECRVSGAPGGGNPNNRASLEVGAVEWNAEVSAGGSSFTIAGAVTVVPGIGATPDFTRNAVLAGTITLGPAVTATLDFTSNASLVGALTLAPVVAAGLSFGRDFALSGAVSVTPAVGAALDFTRNGSLVGDVTVGPAVAATLDFTSNAALNGAVAVTPGVAAGLSFGGDFALAGAVTVTVSAGAGLAFTRHPVLAGALTLTASPGAVLAQNIHPALAGSLTLGSVVAAALSYTTGDKTLAGAVALGVTPMAAGLLFGGPASVVARSALSGTVERTNLAGVFTTAELSGEVS